VTLVPDQHAVEELAAAGLRNRARQAASSTSMTGFLAGG
jgi:hypothetical protein